MPLYVAITKEKLTNAITKLVYHSYWSYDLPYNSLFLFLSAPEGERINKELKKITC